MENENTFFSYLRAILNSHFTVRLLSQQFKYYLTKFVTGTNIWGFKINFPDAVFVSSVTKYQLKIPTAGFSSDLTFAPTPPSGKLLKGFFYLFSHFFEMIDTLGSWDNNHKFFYEWYYKITSRDKQSLAILCSDSYISIIQERLKWKCFSSQILYFNIDCLKMFSLSYVWFWK